LFEIKVKLLIFFGIFIFCDFKKLEKSEFVRDREQDFLIFTLENLNKLLD